LIESWPLKGPFQWKPAIAAKLVVEEDLTAVRLGQSEEYRQRRLRPWSVAACVLGLLGESLLLDVEGRGEAGASAVMLRFPRCLPPVARPASRLSSSRRRGTKRGGRVGCDASLSEVFASRGASGESAVAA